MSILHEGTAAKQWESHEMARRLEDLGVALQSFQVLLTLTSQAGHLGRRWGGIALPLPLANLHAGHCTDMASASTLWFRGVLTFPHQPGNKEFLLRNRGFPRTSGKVAEPQRVWNPQKSPASLWTLFPVCSPNHWCLLHSPNQPSSSQAPPPRGPVPSTLLSLFGPPHGEQAVAMVGD